MTEPGSSKPAPHGPPIWAPLEKLYAVLERWAEEHAGKMTLRRVADSVQGRPVYVAELTDSAADSETKEHVLLTALHCGVERNMATTVLCVMEWLLSDDALAQETLRRQVIVCMPVPNPDDYVAGKHGDVCGPWTLEGPPDPEAMPEAMAVKALMDEYQPEVHADVHGLSLAFEKYICLESSASSYSNFALRPYHRDIMRLMDEAALVEGYPSDRQEADAERMLWGPQLQDMSAKLWIGRPRIYAHTYCYDRYHTLVSLSELCWERSGLLRLRRLFEIGNGVWPGEYFPGYPTRVIASNIYHVLTAYGQTAAARRRSRVELWNKQDQLTYGRCDPTVEGKILFVCATSHEARRTWLKHERTVQEDQADATDHMRLPKDITLAEFVAKMDRRPAVDGEALRRFAAGWPAGQNGPVAFLGLWNRGWPLDYTRPEPEPGTAEEACAPIEHGLALRLRIPFAGSQIVSLLLNGAPVQESEANGYVTWAARGFRYVQINIPPAQTRTEDLFVVTCEYDPGETRTHWQRWRELAP